MLIARKKARIVQERKPRKNLFPSDEESIDIANRIGSLEGQPPASESYQSLCTLKDLGVIESADRYRDMIRFRNFVVHRYENIKGYLSCFSRNKPRFGRS